ncbi:semaphorin-7A-like isoform X2 [Colossoma macropomum]|uniref:semaphorin-7A-like isoform X2 n=1 Tax=Colossoma macropomum TaxID=42526 RepID=UPI001864CA1A|nr:semaphorin-7A-like isoform X2 [Colossoma macropomum]
MQGNTGDVNETALYTGDTLYFTISGQNNAAATLGLYRQKAKYDYTWPQTREIAQRYIKLIANEGSAAEDGKLYSFYTEKNLSEDPETPLWIPRVSQYCMSDTGGRKNQLQYRWTSMLTARLFCGDKKRRVTFTELLDVAVLEAENWDNTMIYALFKNHYNISAVCVYKMSTITRIFKSSIFRSPVEAPPPAAGECVTDKSSVFLKFMEKRPEMAEWIEPERGPLLISQSQYTHLQVDRVTSRNNVQHSVLLLTLGNGRIHKVVERDDGPFIIAEYQPFESETRIHSMLLDRSTKKLYVSSSSELVQIDLQDCSVYGKQCDCVLARDPYCGWSGTECSPATEYSVQDVTNGDYAVCEAVCGGN